MKRSFLIAFLIATFGFSFSQQNFVKRINRGLYNYGPGFIDIINNGNAIYFGGATTTFTTGPFDIYKADKHGNIIWTKNYSIDNVIPGYQFGKMILFKGGIFTCSPVQSNGNYGINVSKLDTANGNIIYSKNIELAANLTTFDMEMYESDIDHLLIKIENKLVRFNTLTGNVTSVVAFSYGPDLIYINEVYRNSNSSLILSGYYGPYPNFGYCTMKLQNDNSFTLLNGNDVGGFTNIFNKGNGKLIGFQQSTWISSPSSFVFELDSSFNITKRFFTPELINWWSSRMFQNNSKIYLHTYDKEMIMDTSFNFIQCRADYVPADFTASYPANILTCGYTVMGNGIYSVKSNTYGVMGNKCMLSRSDTMFVNPCNTTTTYSPLSPTTIPSVSNFTCTIIAITPTTTVPNFTVTAIVVGDSTYCTTTTDIRISSLNKDFKLRYSDKSVNISSEKEIQEACLYDIFGRKIRNLEGRDEIEIANYQENPGIYFVGIIYTDRTYSKIKILLN